MRLQNRVFLILTEYIRKNQIVEKFRNVSGEKSRRKNCRIVPKNHSSFRRYWKLISPIGSNKTGSLTSALYLRLKKRKVFKMWKGGPFRLFENPLCCKMSKKWRRTLWRHFENFERKLKKPKIFVVPKYLKATLWAFWNCSLLQNKLEGGPFVNKTEKSRTVPKKGTL